MNNPESDALAQAVAMLRESETRNRTILATVASGIVTIDEIQGYKPKQAEAG